MKRFRWQSLIPVIAVMSLLVLGYYLDAGVIKMLGIIGALIVLIILC